MEQILSYLLMPFTEPMLTALVAVGTFAGVYVGAIPGLNATMAVSLLVSFTFGWNVNHALALMIGIYQGTVFGGSRSAILLNIPGAPAAVATVFDGYPLALKGQAGVAMGIATVHSAIGGILGVIALGIGAPVISKFALFFAPRDYLLLGCMGLMLIGSLGTYPLVKGLIAAVIGMLFKMVGMDAMTATHRFTFGNPYLLAGIDTVVALIGMLGVSEALIQIRDLDTTVIKQKISRIVPKFNLVTKNLGLTFRTSIIGIIVGALPGAGGTIAALLAYDHAKRTVKNPEVPFGEGAIEGIIAPETSNNAAVGGAFIPMLTLGIPGDAVTAVLLGALYMHGLRPGPSLMTETPHLFYLIVSCLALSCAFTLIFGLTGIRLFSKVVEIPKGILMPIIVVLSVTGVYAVNNRLFDIFWMMGFGILGYLMKRYGYPTGPMVLGLILADLIEQNFRRGIVQHKTVVGFFLSYFTHPISIVLMAMFVFSIIVQTKWYKQWRAKKDLAV